MITSILGGLHLMEALMLGVVAISKKSNLPTAQRIFTAFMCSYEVITTMYIGGWFR